MSTLVLTAHGSKDPRSAANAWAVADRLRLLRPDLDVRLAFCELNAPRLPDVLTPGAVVTPFLLADAYHARIDIPRQIAGFAGVRQARVLGEDERLVTVMGERLTAVGVSGSDQDLGVLVLAVGSTKDGANECTAAVTARLASGTHWVGAMTAFATGIRPSPAEAADHLRRRGARRLVIAPWFLAPGLLLDRVSAYARSAGISMAAPLGAHRLVAETVLDGYDQTVADRAAA